MPKPTLIIGNKNYSSWSLRPWIFMKHHQLDFEEKRVALFTETTAKELSEYNSDLKVPVLKDDNLVVWDSLSIVEYISEKYLDSRGWPANAHARAVARSISSEMHSSYSSVRNELPMNCRRTVGNISFSRDAAREIERISWLWRECRSEYGAAGEWLFGDFSIADAMFAPVALRFYIYSVPLAGVQERYVKRVLNHTGIVEWIEAGKLETEVIEAYETTP